MTKRYILFDLDGTITDSSEGITKSVQHALKKLGIEENDQAMLRRFIGPPLDESFEKFYGFDKEKALKAVDYYRERYSDKGIYENVLFDGIADMLEGLKSDGYIVALATCKPAMRRTTKIGNWIAGWTSKQLKDSPTEVGKEKLVYLAKVTQKLSFAEYWEKFEQKRPVKTEDTKVIQRYGDNIYKPNPTNPKEFIQIENNFLGKDKMEKDLRGEYVLI